MSMIKRSMNLVRKLHLIVLKVRLAREQHGKSHVMMASGKDAHMIVVFIHFLLVSHFEMILYIMWCQC